jgi:hypothetical protein
MERQLQVKPENANKWQYGLIALGLIAELFLLRFTRIPFSLPDSYTAALLKNSSVLIVFGLLAFWLVFRYGPGVAAIGFTFGCGGNWL